MLRVVVVGLVIAPAQLEENLIQAEVVVIINKPDQLQQPTPGVGVGVAQEVAATTAEPEAPESLSSATPVHKFSRAALFRRSAAIRFISSPARVRAPSTSIAPLLQATSVVMEIWSGTKPAL
jgi:hypothetical protein